MARAKTSTQSKTLQEGTGTPTPVSDIFTDAKSWYQSKTIIGVIITAVGGLLSAFYPDLGIDIPGAVDVLLEDGQTVAEQADVTFGSLIMIWGTIQALWGRITAKVKIKSVIPQTK